MILRDPVVRLALYNLPLSVAEAVARPLPALVDDNTPIGCEWLLGKGFPSDANGTRCAAANAVQLSLDSIEIEDCQ